MNDNQLDELLHHDRRRWDERVTDAMTSMVCASRVEAASTALAHPRPVRRGWLVGAILVGAIGLTAGASVTAAQLGIPPFQTIETGTERVASAVPVAYTESDGTAVACQAFMEFRNLDGADQARVESDIKSHDWTGIGQAAYDAARAGGGTANEISSRFGDQIAASLFGEAKRVFPQLVHGPSDTTGIVFNGYGMSCSPQNNW